MLSNCALKCTHSDQDCCLAVGWGEGRGEVAEPVDGGCVGVVLLVDLPDVGPFLGEIACLGLVLELSLAKPGALVVSADLTALGVEDHFVLVLPEDRELGAVHGAELVGGQAEHEGGEGVDLDESLPTVLVATEGGVHGPLRADVTKRRTGEGWVGPPFLLPGRVIELLPKRGVVGSQTVETEHTEQHWCVEVARLREGHASKLVLGHMSRAAGLEEVVERKRSHQARPAG